MQSRSGRAGPHGRSSVRVVALAALMALVPALAGRTPAVASDVPWTPMTAPTPGGTHNAGLVSVSCPANAGKFCVAVGYAFTALGGSNLAEVWKGGAWKISSTPDPGGASAADAFTSVSCGSPTYCMALGSGIGGTFSELWNGSKWSVPATTPGGAVHDISCVVTECLAVGFQFADDTYAPAAAFWDGSSWTSVPPDGSLSQLTGVGCYAPGHCLVVGESSATVLGQVYDDGAWTDEQASDGGSLVSFRSVACQTANTPVTCLASGFSQDNGENTPLSEVWNQSTGDWLPTAPATEGALSCPTATVCVAVGTMSLANRDAVGAAAESWNGTAWTPMDTSRVNSNPFLKWLEFRAASCPSPTFCVAVGDKSLKTAEAASWGTAP